MAYGWLALANLLSLLTASFQQQSSFHLTRESWNTDSVGSLAAVEETFPPFKETMLETASFLLSNAEADAMAAAFLPWLSLPCLKRRLAQHRYRNRNHSAPSKRQFKPALLRDNSSAHGGNLCYLHSGGSHQSNRCLQLVQKRKESLEVPFTFGNSLQSWRRLLLSSKTQ